jgi:uncharacterized repeat protein (TIGR01451 family)
MEDAMLRASWMTGIVAGAVFCVGAAQAAPSLRVQVDQAGDFAMIGNTLGHDCATGVPAPVVGTVGACGTNTNDSAPDVFWRADDAGDAVANTSITLQQARSTAMLILPSNAQVTHAFLYWSGESTAGNQADSTATIERPGVFTQDVTAIDSATSSYQGSDYYYQSVAEVTSLVQAHGAGAFRVSGVETQNLVNRADEVVFAAWSLVVFYRLDSDPQRNLALFDGLDLVATTSADVTLSGFLVPNAGFDAKLGVIAYEGDGNITGDQIRFGTGILTAADRLGDDANPLSNFFNSTRSQLGTPVSNVGDLPQLTGGSRSMGSFDLDVVDITSRLSPGQTSANIQATTTGDVYFLGAFITSISTYKPNFATSTKVVTDVNGGGLLAGDVLEYTVDVVNTGNDAAVNLQLADALPFGVTYVPGSLEILTGPNAGGKTDALDGDQGEFDSGLTTVVFRLGTGADGTTGGSLEPGESSRVRFRVTVNAGATGAIENQAVIVAEGSQGAPQESTPTDGNGSGPGAPPTVVWIDECGVHADCMDPKKPLCDTAPEENVCVQCLASSDCEGTTPVCDGTGTCVGCGLDADCGGNTPACQPSGACGQCSASNDAQCGGTTPVCDEGSGDCVGCSGDEDCGGSAPACQVSGACGQCSATNGAACTGSTPFCDESEGVCVECLTHGDCDGAMPVCVGGVCVAGCVDDDDCEGSMPVCDTAASLCVECLSDGDCDGSTPVCDMDSNKCICVKDSDCGGPTSGRVCDGEACVAGCRGDEGNGCPAFEVCTSLDETVGTCVEADGGAGGSGGSGGTGLGGSGGTGLGGSGGTGLGGSGGTGLGGSGGTGLGGGEGEWESEGALEGGGCSCSVPTPSRMPFGLAWWAGLAGLWVLGRRRGICASESNSEG